MDASEHLTHFNRISKVKEAVARSMADAIWHEAWTKHTSSRNKDPVAIICDILVAQVGV